MVKLICFHENGKVAEKGNWKNNSWIGKYQQFDSLGILIAEYDFNQQGKREGITITYCDFGYIEKSGDTRCDKEIKPRVFNGQQTLYNKNKQTTKDGVFKDNRFMDGKAYIYDDNGILTRIAVYKQGIYVGDAAIE